MPNENRITNALQWIAGWWLAEKNIAQISLNLTDMDVIISSPPTFHLQRIYPIDINQPFCNCSIFNICFTCVNAGDANARGLWGGEEGRWRNRSCCDWLRIGQFQKELKNNCCTIVIVQAGSSTSYHQVGLVPLASLLDAADFYMEKEGLMVLEEDQKVILFTRIISDACGEYLTRTFYSPPCHKTVRQRYSRGVKGIKNAFLRPLTMR